MALLRPLRIFTTEYCCPTDSLEFHGAQKRALLKGVDEECSIRPAHREVTVYSNAGLLEQAERAAEKKMIFVSKLRGMRTADST